MKIAITEMENRTDKIKERYRDNGGKGQNDSE